MNLDFKYLAWLVSENMLEEVFLYLEEDEYSTISLEEIVLLKSRYNSLIHDNIRGVLTQNEYAIMKNKINSSLFNLIETARKKSNTSFNTVSSKERSPHNLLELSFEKINPRIKKIFLKYDEYKYFQDLLNQIFIILYPDIKPISYGKSWYLMTNSMPIFHNRNIENSDGIWDRRTLEEIGIATNVIVEVIGKEYLNEIFEGVKKSNIIIKISNVDQEKIFNISIHDRLSFYHIYQEMLVNKEIDSESEYTIKIEKSGEKLNFFDKIKEFNLSEDEIIQFLKK